MIADKTTNVLEGQRLALQAELDSQKTQAERNQLGQFATPTSLAVEILTYARTLMDREPISFLDPAIGTGSFYSALLEVFPHWQIKAALGFEIDPHYAGPAARLLDQTGLNLKLADFTHQEPIPSANLVICNPPYVRHHHLPANEKTRLQLVTYQVSGMKLSGLAGLYGYFLGLAHGWMAENGLAGWLIPSEFMDVNYGQAMRNYLLTQVTLLRIHRFDPNDVQFADALVSSAVVWFRKSRPPEDHHVTFSFGGGLLAPAMSREVPASNLYHEHKWTRFPGSSMREKRKQPVLADFFRIKRGLVTGDNDFFILNEHEIQSRSLPMELFRPILPSPRYLPDDEVTADAAGVPILERRLFLLDTRLHEDEIRERYPALSNYLEEGKTRGVNERYISRHRSPWYSQEDRPAAPIVCTYLGRTDSKNGRPFRFILNGSEATVANVYLALYPIPRLTKALELEPSLLRRIWLTLNQIAPEQLVGEGRVYGGGLHKLEPKELANVDASTIAQLLDGFGAQPRNKQLSLFGEQA